MSIIQEALKKVEKPDLKKEKELKQEDPEVKKDVSVPVNKTHSGNLWPGPRPVYYALTALLVLILAGIVIRASSPAASTAPAPIQPRKVGPIMPSIERREEAPVPKRRKENIGGFVLNGIMYLVDGPRAIINDIIVGEGETVDGAKVEKIKKDQVLLKYNDSEVALDINR